MSRALHTAGASMSEQAALYGLTSEQAALYELMERRSDEWRSARNTVAFIERNGSVADLGAARVQNDAALDAYEKAYLAFREKMCGADAATGAKCAGSGAKDAVGAVEQNAADASKTA